MLAQNVRYCNSKILNNVSFLFFRTQVLVVTIRAAQQTRLKYHNQSNSMELQKLQG